MPRIYVAVLSAGKPEHVSRWKDVDVPINWYVGHGDTAAYVSAGVSSKAIRERSWVDAANEAITKIALPRHIKITNDDGTGMTLQDLGIFGISGIGI